MNAMPTTTTAAVSQRREQVLQKVMLVSPNMGWWRGQYVLSKKLVNVKFNNVELDDESATTPQTRLINDRSPTDAKDNVWIKRFRDLKNEQTKLLDRFSVGSGITGVRLIPKAAGATLFPLLIGPTVGELKQLRAVAESQQHHAQVAELDQRLAEARENSLVFSDDLPVFDPTRGSAEQSVNYRLHLAAEEFCRSLTDVYAKIRRDVPSAVWEEVQNRLPASPQAMREKFYCGTIPIEFAATERDPAKVQLTAHDLRQYQASMSASVRTAVDTAIENMLVEPRKELAKAIDDMTDLIARDGRVTARTFKPVQRAIEKLRMFSFVSGPEMLQQINQLETLLDNHVPKELTRSTADSSGFTSAISQMRNELETELRAASDMDRFSGVRSVLI